MFNMWFPSLFFYFFLIIIGQISPKNKEKIIKNEGKALSICSMIKK